MIWIQKHAELLFCLVGCMLVTVIPRVGPVMYLHAESLPDKGGSPDHGGQKQYQKILDWHLESCGFRTGRNDSCRQNCSF